MIRLATRDELLFDNTTTEAAIRIRALADAYGDAPSIVRFYTDDRGAFMSLTDSAGVLYAPGGVDEEWLSFLSFVPDVYSVRTDVVSGAVIAGAFGVSCKQGILMRYAGDKPCAVGTVSSVRLDDVYPLLVAAFPSMPPFDVWYVDVSHKVRHGHCRIACILQDAKPVSCAMSIAQTKEAALLGAVATHPDWRRRGYASRCVLSLVSALFDRRIYIAPVDAAAEKLYNELGFVACDTWAEVVRR